MKNTVLKIENLNVSFEMYHSGLKKRETKIIKNLNLDLFENEILAIFGASGSGKTILAHSIMGILPKNAKVSGDIIYKGKKLFINDMEDIRKNEIGFIPQTVNSLNPLLKIRRQIDFFINERDKKEEKIKKLFEKFSLDLKVLDMYPNELSGGMARKTIVLLSMINEKNLIIADEPTPGMDDMALNETVSFFKNLKSQNKSAIVITHDIDTALKFADKIAVFNDGAIVEISETSAFCDRGEKLKNQFSKDLWNSLPQNMFFDLK